MKLFSFSRQVIHGLFLLSIVTTSFAQEMPSDARPDSINAQLSKDYIDLGYSKMERKYVTSSVSFIKPGKNSIPTADINRQLQGLVSGVTVIGDGQPYSVASVMVRGGFTPYYVVDGIPVHNITGLNANDIESVTILKDGAAAIYGMRAMNGVVVVNTKKGNDGLHVSYNMSLGMQYPGRGNTKDLLNTREYADLQWLVYQNDKLDGTVDGSDDDNLPDFVVHPIYGSSANPEPSIPDWAANTDWYDALTDKAGMMKHDLAISGAGEMGRFYLGFGYLKQNGIVIHNYAERYNARINSEINLFKGHLKIGENFGYNRQSDLRLSTRYQAYPIFIEMLRLQPIIPVYISEEIEGIDRTFMPGEYGGTDISYALGNGINVVAHQERNKEDEYIFHHYTGNVYAEGHILEGLFIRTSYGINQYNGNSIDFYFRSYENRSSGTISRAFEEERKSRIRTWTNTINFDRSFGIHRVQALLGYEESDIKPEEYENAEFWGEFDNKEEYRQVEKERSYTSYFKSLGMPQKSIFARVDYGLLDRYFIGAIIRHDNGVSGQWEGARPVYYYTYYSKKEWYPSISASWSIANEPFMKKISWISELKIRGSYGETGDMNNNWQCSEIADIGFETMLFKNHFGISMDWFSNVAKNMLIPYYLMSGSNTGEYKFTGTDIDIHYQNSWNNFHFSVGLAFSTYKSRIKKIHDLSYYYFTGMISGEYIVKNQVGHPLSAFNGYKVEGIFQDQEEVNNAPDQAGTPGGLKYANIADADNFINFYDLTVIGDPNPDFTTGLNINLTWKNMDLNAFFYASKGNDVFNYTKAFTDFWFPEMGQKNRDLLYNSWTESNKNGSIPVASEISRPFISDYFIEDGSYLRMKNLQLGYNLSPDVLRNIKLSGLRIYIQAVNLFTITNYSGFDPEVGGLRDAFGIDMGNYPNAKQFIVGLQAEI
jgi:TonB-dependent SusC/RagA subfamily outer membrane receptor